MGEKYNLVEKLRSLYFADEVLLEEAADRIEQLVATCEKLEAKLAEVVAVGVRQNEGWKCPINSPNCEENCGNYGCGN